MTYPIPTTPWSFVAQDIFDFEHRKYLITVDYYSDYFEVDKLENTKGPELVEKTKAQFSRHGIPDMVSDNGPPFDSFEYLEFRKQWNFCHGTSSPYHSQSNGKAEAAVKIAKRLLKKTR